MSVGVVIGRFQTPDLSEAHMKLLDAASRNHRLIVLIGVPRLFPTKRNALDFEMRRLMINEAFPEAICLPLHDMWSDFFWSRQVDNIISGIVSHEKDIKIYHGRDSFKSHYHGRYKTFEIESIDDISATKIRESIKVINSSDFRKGVIHSVYNQFPRIVSCVDVLLYERIEDKLWFIGGMKEDYEYILMPGGHVDVGDKTIWDAGLREAGEEIGFEYPLKQFKKEAKIITQRYINSFRNTEDAKLWTTLLAMEVKGLRERRLKAGDDLIKAGVHCYQDDINRIDSEHKSLIGEFLEAA